MCMEGPRVVVSPGWWANRCIPYDDQNAATSATRKSDASKIELHPRNCDAKHSVSTDGENDQGGGGGI